MEFRWNEWNVEHIRSHGVTPAEAESVVRTARGAFPQRRSDDKWLAWGKGQGDRLLQVVFVLSDDDCVYVIHARPLTDREKKAFHRRKPK